MQQYSYTFRMAVDFKNTPEFILPLNLVSQDGTGLTHGPLVLLARVLHTCYLMGKILRYG